jgi:hypothetical protein
MRMLRQAGKKAVLAADKAKDIIDKLHSGKSTAADIGSITKHGELRIRGCVKYDLGSGYRLITFKQGHRIYLLYAGTHDDCHRWIENNRELDIDQIKKRYTKLAVEYGDSISGATGEAKHATAKEEDHDPLADLNEQVLRYIFRGLVNSP